MDWAPNIEGVQWFLQHVWNVVQPQLDNVSLYLAGKNMPPSLRSKESENLHIVGEVEDVTLFSLEKNIMIVPLLSGAGIRIKILEAMALGKTIITTNIGAEGIGATHRLNILIANTVEEFIATLHFCFEDTEEATKIGSNAREFVLTHYLKDKIYSDLINHIQLTR